MTGKCCIFQIIAISPSEAGKSTLHCANSVFSRQRAQELDDSSRKLLHIPRLAFPDRHHRKSQSSQFPAAFRVAFAVSPELGDPISAPRRRDSAAAAAVQMPKATVDIDHLRQPRQHDIRRPRQIAPMQPIPKPQPVQEPPNDHLRRGVFGFNRRHDAGTLIADRAEASRSPRCDRHHTGHGDPDIPQPRHPAATFESAV